ncbi:MAG: hypothetical protein ACRDHO_12005, partial [Actinomycetota bacterium]
VMVREALKGKFRFVKEILDRVEGKVPARPRCESDPGDVAIAHVLRWPPSEPPGLLPPPASD